MQKFEHYKFDTIDTFQQTITQNILYHNVSCQINFLFPLDIRDKISYTKKNKTYMNAWMPSDGISSYNPLQQLM